MSQEGLTDEQIEQVLGIGGQTMRQLRAMSLATGGVVGISVCHSQPHALDGLNAWVHVKGFTPLCLTWAVVTW